MSPGKTKILQSVKLKPYFKTDNAVLYHIDCITLLEQLPAVTGLTEITFQPEAGSFILIIKVQKSTEPTYVKINGKEEFYCREDNSSRKLEVREIPNYIARRFVN